MRLDDAGPRTWLLAAVAAWALTAWLLAVVGMGGRVGLLADDPGLFKTLPPVRPAPPPRLGPLGQYDAIATRPVFAEDRKPHPFFLEGEGDPEAEKVFDYILTSVLITPRLKLAILQPAKGGDSVRVRLDQAPASHPDWQLVGLSERSAVFEGSQGERTLQLRVYDGVGGERPTQVDARAADARIPVVPPPAGEPTLMDGPPPVPAKADDGAMVLEPATADQMESVRRRIEQRRAQLRGESQSQPPAKTP